MSSLHAPERDRMLATLRALLRRVTVAGRPVAGFAAENSPGAPLRALDNAVVAEALALPELRAADPVLAAAAPDFLAALADAGEADSGQADAGRDGAMPRAAAVPMARVAIRRDDPADLRVVTPWHVLTGDLTRGVLVQSLRGEEDDPGRAVRHTGNLVRLSPAGVLGLRERLGLRPPSLDVEEAITAAGVVAEGRGALLFHEGRCASARARGAARPARGDPADRVPVSLTIAAAGGGRPPRGAGGRAARRPGEQRARRALGDGAPDARRGGDPARRRRVAAAGRAASEDGGTASPTSPTPATAEVLHLWTADAGTSAAGAKFLDAETLSIHLRPRGTAPLHSLRAQARDGAAHWVVLRYDLGPVPAGGVARAEEDRLLLRGRVPSTLGRAAARLRDPGAGGPAMRG
jgi:hypothetical protein